MQSLFQSLELLMISDFPRIALTAASLHSATRSAPLNPFVDIEKFLLNSRHLLSGMGEVRYFIISSRALSSGGPIYIKSSLPPGRSIGCIYKIRSICNTNYYDF